MRGQASVDPAAPLRPQSELEAARGQEPFERVGPGDLLTTLDAGDGRLGDT